MTQLIDSSTASQFDRLPPHDLGAEMCVLASMMLDQEMLGEILQAIDREMFFQADHQVIFDMLVKLYEQNKGVDAVILRAELEKRHLLEEIGGAAYLGQILNTVPSAAHGLHYASIVREKAMLRRLIASSNEVLRDAYAPHDDAGAVLDKAQKLIFAIAEKRIAGQVVPMKNALEEAYEMIEEKRQRGLETGFFDLDDMLNGLQPSEMIIVAARPSMGKTAFAMNMIEGLAADKSIPCAIFSLEMSRQQLAQRLLCGRARIDSHKMRRGMLNAEEYQKIASAVTALSKAPVWVDDTPGLTPLEFRAKARRLKMQSDIRCIMIDYLQLMDANSRTAEKEGRQQQITEISRSIKAVARELSIPVIALSQLNRATESRDGHRPRISDLRESGAIEQDADVVLLLHREDYYRMSEPDFQPDNIAEVIVAKQRNGPTGTIKLFFDSKSTRFENLSGQVEPF